MMLYRVRRRDPRNPQVALELGHIYFDRRWRSDGLREYAAALQLRPALAHDAHLIRNCVVALDDPTYRPARALIRRHLGAAALRELRRAERSARTPRVRQRAAALVGELAPHRRR
jgi:hypothetical protein